MNALRRYVPTAKEKQAMEREIRRQLAEYIREFEMSIDALFLWMVHEEFGCGKKKLHQIYDRFQPRLKELYTHYQLDETDEAFLCDYFLREMGVNIKEWSRENPIFSLEETAKGKEKHNG